MRARSSKRKPPRTQTKRPPRKKTHDSNTYWDITHRPLQCLVFLLPLVVIYEFGMALVQSDIPFAARPELAAKQILYWFFSLFGVTGVYLPGFALVAVLLVWHLAKRDPWKISWQSLAGMAGESVLLSIPVLLLNELIHEAKPLAASTHPASSVSDLLLSIGAGIYEELVFRLIAISLLTLLLIDIARLRQVTGVALVVILSSLLFAASHYHPIGADDWSAAKFAFRAAAGAYLAAVFVLRGFGLAVGCHVIYDIIAFAWSQ